MGSARRRGVQTSQVRIIGGEWRSRLIRFPCVEGLRPTPDRVRETLFNWLGQDLTGQICLDLFAGSGALGFEAASRGARSVVMVERDPQAAEALRTNRSLLAGEQVEILQADALAFLRAERRCFDRVFLDPPYSLNLLPGVLAHLPTRLTPGARVYLEADRLPELSGQWVRLKHCRAGQVQGLLLEWQST